MENQSAGETGLSDSGPSSRPMTHGVNGITPSATNFFDQEGAAYFGGLEEALMHGVAGIRSDEERKSLFASRPPTLEIFPSWPMRFQQIPKPEESADSGSVQNTISQLDSESPVSRKASSEQSEEQQQGTMAGDGAPNQQLRTQEKRNVVGGSSSEKDGKVLDAKTLRRLAQNREAARKSRLRKKAYIQQLESSRIKLTQLEQDLQRARTQGLFLGGGSAGDNISSVFDMEYSRWLEENYKKMMELRGGLQAHRQDGDLRVTVDECLALYDELFQLKATAARSDVFHVLTGLWTTPAERCFLWMGGFRPSELLKIVLPQLDPLTEQQVAGICSLQQSCQQAEEALSQGLEQFLRSLADTVTGDSLVESSSTGNYMSQMAIALGKLANLEGFLRQADNLRQQTLHQMHRILTIRQAARCFLAIGEYHSRLRALSSLWASRPRENSINESAMPLTADLQIVHQPLQSHFPAF
ncbi:transcription factor TGA2.2-like isoform X1 [Musa acuminata AAA Group]|uniref:transcription factor TGA2.2-like isoform X1 n=1 Tax=Musa acuminata AAA Group TaxID=214697 RepID=UPI0031DF19FB